MKGDGFTDLQVVFFQVFEQVKVVMHPFDDIVASYEAFPEPLVFVQSFLVGIYLREDRS